MKVRFIRADGRRKVGQVGGMSHAKAIEMIAKGIVEEYSGPWPPREKMNFKLKDLKGNGKNIGADFRNGDSPIA